jgi:glycosyltransferase involved in cell wall biosynthesis
MAAAAVVVVPSRSEALGAVNIEALAVGTPVVAANVGGIGEVVRDGLDGYLVPPDDVDALGERIGRLLADPARRATFGDNARRGFLERFELSAGLARHAQWYEELVAGQRAGRG